MYQDGLIRRWFHIPVLIKLCRVPIGITVGENGPLRLTNRCVPVIHFREVTRGRDLRVYDFVSAIYTIEFVKCRVGNTTVRGHITYVLNPYPGPWECPVDTHHYLLDPGRIDKVLYGSTPRVVFRPPVRTLWVWSDRPPP